MIRELTMDDYDGIIELFKSTPGITFREADSREATERYLKRNPSLSFIAEEGSEILGCILGGHDGRRGYLQHLVVRPDHRNKGIGEVLVMKCTDALDKIGISKAHIFVFKTNGIGNSFWAGKGWQFRDDVNMYSYNSSTNENA
jgi:N-acetylglutamate synthase